MKSKILVTGGAGFIGSYLVGRLLSDGYRVVVIDNLSTGSKANIGHLQKNPNLEFILGDILNYQLMDKTTKSCDIIFHLAAAVGVKLIIDDPVGSLITNVRGTEIILDLASKHNARIFIASSSEVYGKNDKDFLSEEDNRIYGSTVKWRWSYAAGKAIDEFLGLGYYRNKGLPVVIGRFFNIIGPKQKGRYGMVVPRFIKSALANEPITVYDDGRQIRTFTYVSDAIEALQLLMFETPNLFGQIFNIGSEEPVSIVKLAEKIKAMTNSKSKIISVPYEKIYEKGFEDMRKRIPNITKLKSRTGFFVKVNLDTALKKIIKYFMEKKTGRGKKSN